MAAVIVLDDRLVLVRQSRGGAPYHLLPGGGVERGESIGTALAREVAEETGLTVLLQRPLFISDSIAPDGSRHLVNLTFLASAQGSSVPSPLDPSVLGVDLIERHELPSIDLRPPIALELSHAWERHFDVPAAYLGSAWTDGAA